MKIRKILIPVDKNEESLDSIKYLKEYYDPNKVEIFILHVGEFKYVSSGINNQIEIIENKELGEKILDKASQLLTGYSYKAEYVVGWAGDGILNYAEKNNIDVILMAKNTKKKFKFILGSVTEYVAKKTKCTLVIVPEK